MGEGDDETNVTADHPEASEEPEQKHAQERLAKHEPNFYTIGYDGTGDTRVGMGTAEGRIGRLVRQNEGRHRSDGNHSTREAVRDKKRVVQSFCSVLGVSPHQQEEAVRVILQLNLDRFGSQKRLEKVALCVIRFVVDADRERLFLNGRPPTEVDLSEVDFEQYPPKLADEEAFERLCVEYDVSESDRYSISQLIKRELRAQGYFTNEPRE